jgi:hypothetical protein
MTSSDKAMSSTSSTQSCHFLEHHHPLGNTNPITELAVTGRLKFCGATPHSPPPAPSQNLTLRVSSPVGCTGRRDRDSHSSPAFVARPPMQSFTVTNAKIYISSEINKI